MTSPETPPNKGEGHSADADVSRRLGRVANEEIILTEEAKRIIIEGPVRRLEEKRKKAEEEKDKLAAEEAAKAAAEAAAKAAAEAKGAKPIEDAPAPAPAPEAPAAPAPEVPASPAPEAPAAPAPEVPTPEEDTKPDAETSGPRREAKKKSRLSTAFAAFILAALVLVTSKILASNPAEAKKESPTNLPPDRPTAAEVLPTEASYSFEESGHVALADGQEVTRYVYSGGYHYENDPYYTKFDHKDEPDYENDDAYGFQIEGDTPAEKTTNWVKNVMLSPEAIIRLRVQMGLESLDSIEQENNRANELRRMSPEEYDRIANETATAFYDRLEGGSIEESRNWTLENFMIDEAAGSHENSAVHGRYNQDDESDEDADVLLTFRDAQGRNIVSSEQGLSNTKRDTGDPDRKVGEIAWVNMDEGGTWKWKYGDTTIISPPPETPPSTPWGKEGDPHGGGSDVEYSDEVNPDSKVSEEENDNANKGNEGYEAPPNIPPQEGGTPGEDNYGDSGEVDIVGSGDF